MASFEFEVAQNITVVEGNCEGYFAVGGPTLTAAAIIRCASAMDRAEVPNPSMIPIIINEFASGKSLQDRLVSYRELIPGFVTFGEDESEYSSYCAQQTHLAITARELSAENLLLAVMCKLPKEIRSNDEWERKSPLLDLNLRFGNLVVSGNICTVSVDEGIEPLPKPY